MSARRAVTLTVRFLCELAMLAALLHWGVSVGEGVAAWVLGITAAGLALVLWGAFVSPKARWPVPVAVRVIIEFILFGAAAAGLVVVGAPALGVLLLIAAGVTSLLNARDDREQPSRDPVGSSRLA